MSPVVHLTRLRETDEPALVALFIANDVPAVTRHFDPFPLTAATARTLVRLKGQDLYWGVWCADSLVGLAMVRGRDGGYPHSALGLLIDHQWVQRGVGQTAVSLVLDELPEHGVHLVRAKAHDDNEASLKVLNNLGFSIIERPPGRVIAEWRVDSKGRN
jgi:RimJ/RimL family protein N-acetyltransferase